MDNKEIIKGQVMTDEEFETDLKIGINMAIDVLRRHGGAQLALITELHPIRRLN